MAGVPFVSGAARNAVAFGRDPLEFLSALRGTEDGLVRARFGVGPSLGFVTEPTQVETVLVDEHGHYWRPDILSSRTESLTRDGLTQSDGTLWERQRARLQPLFGTDRLPRYAGTIEAVTDEVVADWSDGDTVRLYRWSRPSASGLDPEGEGRKLRVFHFHCGWLAFEIIALLHWYWSE